jgi:hypothetical protein
MMPIMGPAPAAAFAPTARQAARCLKGRANNKSSSGMSTMQNSGGARYASFREFYPFYLSEHRSRTSRRLHVCGTLLALALAATALISGRLALFWAVPVAGYAFAWVGHYFFENNTPATFTYPLYSLCGDFRMLYEVLTGRIRW